MIMVLCNGIMVGVYSSFRMIQLRSNSRDFFFSKCGIDWWRKVRKYRYRFFVLSLFDNCVEHFCRFIFILVFKAERDIADRKRLVKYEYRSFAIIFYFSSTDIFEDLFFFFKAKERCSYVNIFHPRFSIIRWFIYCFFIF